MSRIRLALVAVAATLVFVALVPLAQAASTKPQVVTVTITGLKPTLVGKVHSGKVTFRLVNRSKVARDFTIAGRKSALVLPGKTGVLVVELPKGKHPYALLIKGKAAGETKGVLNVA
jgi:hypothetical protein